MDMLRHQCIFRRFSDNTSYLLKTISKHYKNFFHKAFLLRMN